MTVTGANGGPFTVTFGGNSANKDVPPIVADGTNLVPSNTVAVTTTTGGTRRRARHRSQTMQAIASDPSKFYCLHPPAADCNGANAANLNQIFKDVGSRHHGHADHPSPYSRPVTQDR